MVLPLPGPATKNCDCLVGALITTIETTSSIHPLVMELLSSEIVGAQVGEMAVTSTYPTTIPDWQLREAVHSRILKIPPTTTRFTITTHMVWLT